MASQSSDSTMAIEIVEQNEANEPTAKYVYTESNHRGRFDLIVGIPHHHHHQHAHVPVCLLLTE